MLVQAFYDQLAPLYHLVYQDWEATVARQGEALASLIGEHWGADARTVLDAAVGIGTQALGLLTLGFRVTGADLSPGAVARATREAALRRLALPCLVADFRSLPVRATSVDVVLVCDNALPHLDSETEIRRALAECLRCVRRGGGCLISMRDYPSPSPPSGTVEVRPYGERHWAGRPVRAASGLDMARAAIRPVVRVHASRCGKRGGHRSHDQLSRDSRGAGRRGDASGWLRERSTRRRPILSTRVGRV